VTLDITDKGGFFSGDPHPGGSEFPDYEPGNDRPPRPLRTHASAAMNEVQVDCLVGSIVRVPLPVYQACRYALRCRVDIRPSVCSWLSPLRGAVWLWKEYGSIRGSGGLRDGRG